MVVLDITIVNIALPSAQDELGFDIASRQWVITAYSLAFGSLLLLGGRLSDRVGVRRTLIIGLIGFAAASALGGRRRRVRDPDRGPGGPRRLRRHPRPCRAVHPEHHLHRPRRPREGVRRFLGNRGQRCGHRTATRWRSDGVVVVEMVPLHQHGAGATRRARRTRRRESGPNAEQGRARLARCSHRERRAVLFGLRIVERRVRWLERSADRRHACRVGGSDRSLRRCRNAGAGTAVAPSDRRGSQPRRGLPDDCRHVLRDVRRVPLPHLLHAARSALQPTRHRCGVPSDGRRYRTGRRGWRTRC